METQQLRHFWAAAEHGNLVRAAQALNVTQPTLSRSIKALELQLDVRLLDRTPRGVSLTPFGLEFLKHVRVILNEQERAVLSIKALRSGRKGHINVGVGHSFASTILPLATKKLFDANLNVSMRVREGYYEELVVLLRSGEIDLVLSLLPPRADRIDDLVIKPLVQMRTEIIGRAGHPLAMKKTVSVADLAKAKWLVQDQSHATRSFLDLFERSDSAPPSVIVKTTSMSFLRGLLRVSDFLALVGDQLLAGDLADGTLSIVETQIPVEMRQAGAITRAYGTTPPAVGALIQRLETVLQESGNGMRGGRAVKKV